MDWEKSLSSLRSAVGPALGLSLALSASSAFAQSYYLRNSNSPAGSRPNPEYDALGVHLGGFTAYPRLTVTTNFDDNIYAQPTKTGGVFLNIAPSVNFVSNWSRHALDFQLRYQRDQYINQASQSSNEFTASTSGRIDVDHDSAFNFSVSAAALTEPRTDPDVIRSLAKPVNYRLVSQDISAYREFGHLRLDVQINNGYYTFDDTPLVGGGIYPESSRDEDNISERLRISWALGPNVATFVQVTPNQSYFFHRPFNGFTSFNSSGFQVLGGVNAQLGHFFKADAGVGFLKQTYADPKLTGFDGVAFNFDLTYYPTDLLTITAGANHSVAVSGLPGTPASDVSSFHISAVYELLRTLLITPSLNYSQDRYPGTHRQDDRFGAGLKGTYLVNRTIGITAAYNLITQSSTGGFGGYPFNDNRFSIGVTFQR
jgi:hypothetical protein